MSTKVPPEVSALLRFTPSPIRACDWEVAGVGRRGGHVGVELGIAWLWGSRGHAVILQFPDGKIEAFEAIDLFPSARVAA